MQDFAIVFLFGLCRMEHPLNWAISRNVDASDRKATRAAPNDRRIEAMSIDRGRAGWLGHSMGQKSSGRGVSGASALMSMGSRRLPSANSYRLKRYGFTRIPKR
jgi:hypothetical protein